MLLILDIDWIFTDWKHHYGKDWKVMKAFWSNDRYVLNTLKSTNLFDEIFCLTWDWTWIWIDISKARVEKELWIPVVSTKEKWIKSKYEYVLNHYGDEDFIKNNVVYIWDDLADLKIIRDSNRSATTENAPKLVKKYCKFVSEYKWWEWGLADILLEYMKIKGLDVESLFFN